MVGLSLAVLLLVGLATWRLAGSGASGEQPYVAPVPTQAPAGIDAVGAARVLQQLVAAVGAGDSTAASGLAAPDDTTAADRLGQLADVAAASRLRDFTLRYIEEDGGVAADGTWAAVTNVTWAFDGFDREATAAEISVRFRSTADGVVIAGIGGGELRTPVWMSGAMQVRRSDDLLVIAAADKDLAAYVRLARSAVPDVSSVLTRWRPRLVVEVPADGAALEAALDADSGYYAQIAAVTGVGGGADPGAPIHVFVNPDVFAGLGRAGREVVLAHEATHVATRAPSSQAPTWLIEGFADYVALRDTRLPLSRTAGQVARRVRADGLPTVLPDGAAFDTRGPHLGAAYEAAWLICVTLARRGGPGALEAFYAAVSNGDRVATALSRVFDWTEGDLVGAWRTRLSALL